MKNFFVFTLMILFGITGWMSEANSKPLVVAHRGASGYLPEHSLPAKAMAYAMDADFLEQDVVLSKDGYPVIIHDHFLDRITNVNEVSPQKKRSDGRYYAIDFTLEELKKLKFTEGFSVDNEKIKPLYPSRFPLFKSSFQIHTLAEEIELIQGLNHSTGKEKGLYVEIKSPWFHKKEGRDISKIVLKTLKEYGYYKKEHNIYLQCFDPFELKRIKEELFVELDMELKLVLLITNDEDETFVFNNGFWVPYSMKHYLTVNGIKEISTFASGIGPHYEMILLSDKKNYILTPLLEIAHKNGLEVHPYTFRKDKGKLPLWAKDFEDFLIAFYKIGIDGVFTDFPDDAVKVRDKFWNSQEVKK